MANRIELRKLSINIPVKLRERIDAYSRKMGLNVTASIIYLLNKALEGEYHG